MTLPRASQPGRRDARPSHHAAAAAAVGRVREEGTMRILRSKRRGAKYGLVAWWNVLDLVSWWNFLDLLIVFGYGFMFF